MQTAGTDSMRTPFAPHGVAGRIAVPPSKSLTQRALVAAALAGAPSSIVNALDAEDPRLLFDGLRASGFDFEWKREAIVVGARGSVERATIGMNNNGTGARFLLAQLAAMKGSWTLDGSPRLRQRPFAALVTALRALGATIEPAHGGDLTALGLPLRVTGRELAGGRVSLDPSASSQFVSALLLLGSRLPRGLTVSLQAPPPSRPYLDLTSEVLSSFGAQVVESRGGREWAVVGDALKPTSFTVEGDWSAAAFPLAAAAVAGGGWVEIEGLRSDSRQGDAVALQMLVEAGCQTREAGRSVAIKGPVTRPLRGDLRDCPDLFPALAVVVAARGGRLTGLGGLETKESNRTAVMARLLAMLGFDVQLCGDEFVGPGRIPAGVSSDAPLWPEGDHRIAMAVAVAGSVVRGVQVADSGCVAKSWPAFWAVWPGIFGVVG